MSESLKNGKTALLRVDMQRCFCPAEVDIEGTGELPVPGAPSVIPVVNRLSASSKFDYVVDSKDWHPEDHESFFTEHPGKNAGDIIDLHGLQQRLWTKHGRQNTPGAEFYPTLDRSRCDLVVLKGQDKTVDSYSAFYDNGKRVSTGLSQWLKANGVTTIYVVGFTRPVCVSFTAKDGVDDGFEVKVVRDGCSHLEIYPGADAADIADLTGYGVEVIDSKDII